MPRSPFPLPSAGAAMTIAAAAALIVLIALPVGFIVLQAIFPDFARGSFAGAFTRLDLLTDNSRLLLQTQNTLLLAGAVMLGCLIEVARFV